MYKWILGVGVCCNVLCVSKLEKRFYIVNKM
jgi:hypothetical protein